MNSLHDDRPGSSRSDDSRTTENADIWSSMLSSVASSKRLPQKSIVVLGGTSECQKEFVESLNLGRKKGDKKPPIANAFALGYTYLDVLDADHEDVLARLGLYLVSEPEPAFMPILKPLFTAETIPNTLICILLDWKKPWDWMRQLRTWVRLLGTLFRSLDDDAKRALEDVTQALQSRRGTYADAGGGGTEVTLPLGRGEFDEPIGLPLCVICQNADRIEVLERERGWKDGQFDFVLQFLRTVLLKHGASLIYTIPSVLSPLSALLFSSLNIPSPLRHHTIKHNIIDRDKILIPGPGWDSWGKIRVLGEAFDVEGICNGWSVDISPGFAAVHDDVDGGAVEIYEDVIKDALRDGDSLAAALKPRGIEVEPVDTQEFLAEQMEQLEAKREDGGRDRGGAGAGDGGTDARGHGRSVSKGLAEGAVREHVGPVQFNVGGIQMDADDMVKNIKAREASRAAGASGGDFAAPTSPAEETLEAFFSSLMRRDVAGTKKASS
ncbi:dynein light intermediate chain-domain-containing protein [Kalaharituber pfeilii]|nr:dynein light intermediate chain-domain-containing protein [Kalaharituber pfeilii]